ncbi:acyl-CoA/acyl-ACP dehydrogenase [Leucobacter rhizosphaerae]|uniref:Acyl-CoA/acyl-ACP dehydrogenase n=1 Tax=Leucobacter rhizosphaerae TaxID=2932245 RepID=A0ABY4FUX6_9MICO|nr:acyl-CoA dehydrogenase family protein [Leucobacter rhizosphaerae]UOQ60116.1 acyl-CoA/acyl-ACP dehydrogenase [Leucobacter rhizosphaerae]
MTGTTIDDLLPPDLLRRARDRAATTDAENRFFAEDFEELRAIGYLAAVVPDALGGSGLSLESLVTAQRCLAAHAPATSLGVNMHLVWTQVARFLHDRGITTLDGVLRDAVAGEVFGFGISEAGNDAVLLDSTSTAEPHPDGGYRISGTKVFTTLSPVWTRLGVHARCERAGADPELVFGFVRREAAGVRDPGSASAGLAEGRIEHPGTWNPLGMRATQSWTTRLDGVRVRPDDVAARIAPFDGRDPLVLAIFSSFSILTASVYAGIADRALELARAAANRPAPRPGGGEPDGRIRLDDPDTAATLTAAVLRHRRSLDALTLLARDVDERRERDDWFLALAAARNEVCDEARAAVDVAMRLTGSRGFQADSELARLYRDVLAGLFHPSSSAALAATVRGSLADPA